jgi:hypothetical protein
MDWISNSNHHQAPWLTSPRRLLVLLRTSSFSTEGSWGSPSLSIWESVVTSTGMLVPRSNSYRGFFSSRYRASGWTDRRLISPFGRGGRSAAFSADRNRFSCSLGLIGDSPATPTSTCGWPRWAVASRSVDRSAPRRRVTASFFPLVTRRD